LASDVVVDVAIVGAGFTGLWTAYALKVADPALRIAVLEREVAGFGASGRNGGWCSALFAGSRRATAKRHGRDAAIAMQRAMFTTLDEIESAITTEGIDCDWARGGTVQVATAPAQLDRLRSEIEDHRAWGFGDDDYCELARDDAAKLIGCGVNYGALFTPHCAAIHPAKLVRGLTTALERRGVVIYEHTPVTAIARPNVSTPGGTVRAEVVVRATEAFTPGRMVVPIYSLMIATEPLPASFWADAHLDTRPTFADFRHAVIYGQRTADDRLAFGGLDAPYHFGSRIRPSFDREDRISRQLRDVLRWLFPAIGDVAITHRWGGAIGVPRDWYPSVGYDRASGIAWGGGYVGDGVSTTNLAGRTIADLILGRETDLVQLPWVGHRSPQWEPEPLRWIGISTARALLASIDRADFAGKTPMRRNKIAHRLLGDL
jgi:glycine/D-amino acid oxidase-like deaminating enzyme